MISIIVAMSENRVIGRGSAIPWDIPEDRRRFRELTMGHPLIMGRRTYESIGRALPGRRTIVLTRQWDYEAPGCETAHELDSAIAQLQESSEIFICGGAEVYRAALPLADRIFLTLIHRTVAGDVFFPLVPDEFIEISREYLDEKGEVEFILFARKNGSCR